MKRFFTILTILSITTPFFSFSQTSLPLSRTIWNSTPADWTDNGTGSYTSSYACSGNNGGRLDSSGDFYEVFFSDTPDQLDYTLKVSSTSTNSLLVEEFDGSSWSTVVNHTVLPTSCTDYNHTLSATTTRVRWTYTKVSGNLTMDDVGITKAVPTGPSVTFDSGTSAATETTLDFNVDIPVTVSNYGGTQIDIDLTVTGGTAEPGDYTLITNNLSFIADGSQNVSLTVHDDMDIDDETIEITITETSSTGSTITTAIHTLTITDDDLPREINLQSSTGTTIMNGDSDPSIGEGTDFEMVELGMNSTSTITIQNTGGADLITGAITISGTDMADFTISNYTAGTVISGAGSTTFDIEFTPSSIGVKSATISIVNDDSDENPYTFDITGEGFSLEEIAITEFMVAPNSSGVEFVEIYNYGATAIDLMGWILKDEDADNDVISASSLIIEAGAYLILADNKTAYETAWFNGITCDQVIEVTGITLANGTDEIILENGNGDTVWSLAYANDDAAGIATHYTEATFTNRYWGSKLAPGVDRDGNDVTNSLGYERNNITADPLVFASSNSDMGSPLDRTACYEREIDVQGGASLTSIMSGDAAPEIADGTEVIAIIGMASMQTFTIENQGPVEDLVVTGITSDNGSFTISGAVFPLTVAAGMTATFTVGFTSTMIGMETATITIANDDADEATYTFDVRGTSPDLTLGDGCTTAVSAAVDGSGTMIHFLDASNRLVASVSSTGTDFSASGDEIDFYTNVGSATSSTAVDGYPYLIMGRQFNIESVVTAPYTGLTVRLYFNNSDYSDLAAVTCPTCPPMDTPATDVELSHYDGSNQNCDQSDNDYSATLSENLGGVDGTYGSTAFYIEVNPTHFSEFFGHQANAIAFPVELTFFTGKKSGKDNVLNWQTATEINNELFIIERSDNASDWKEIGMLSGAGNSTDPIDYSFIDNDVATTQYYRLKQIDFDGTFAYSDVVTVVRKENAHTVSEFYPNPSHTGTVSIDYLSIKNEALVISGFDVKGKLVFREVRTVTNGSNQLAFDFKGLERGLYIIKLQAGDQQIQRKLMLD